ncbi:MAG: polyribonucleotide nucleotidyltransferase, partial [Candidatus Omnitrophica bacterium]|nr:polyribonucleotide nucleotidyltransferase [Candidatus Omnitrophota bacterium]
MQFGNETLIFETGKMAKQANAAVTVQCGGTVVLVTVVMSKETKEGVDFFPLTVEYKEKTYAAGKIPGGFFKREGRPSEKEVLTSRLIDRPIRPLFPEGFYNELQIFAMVLSSDGNNDSDILSMLGASCALMISDIPFLGPIGAVKIARIEDKFIVNPSYAQLEQSSIELVLAGTKAGINMIESGCKQVSEELMLEAMRFGYKELLKIIDEQEKFAKKCGKAKAEIKLKELPQGLYNKVKELASGRLADVYKIGGKEQREEELNVIGKDLIANLITTDSPYTESDVIAALV